MTTSSDTFARFVDTLASNLDDHDADGAAIAAIAAIAVPVAVPFRPRRRGGRG